MSLAIDVDLVSETSVYFADTVTGLVTTIGTARNPDMRLGELQTGCPGELMLIATTSGGRDVEQALKAEARRRRSRQLDVPDIAASIRRQIMAVANRLDPQDPDDLLAVRDLANALHQLHELVMVGQLAEGNSYAVIGNAVGLSRQAVRQWAERHRGAKAEG